MSTLTTEAPAQRSPLTLGDLGYETLPSGLTLAEIHAYRIGWDRTARSYLRKHGGPAIVHVAGQPAPEAGSAAARLLAQSLATLGREYRTETHGLFHKGAMSALRSYLRKSGQLERLAEIVDPCAPVKAARKPRKVTATVAPAVAPVVAEQPAEQPADIVAAGVASGRVMLVSVTSEQPADTSDAASDVAAADAGDLSDMLSEARDIGARVRADVHPSSPLPWTARKPLRRAVAESLRASGLEPRGAVWDAATSAAGLGAV